MSSIASGIGETFQGIFNTIWSTIMVAVNGVLSIVTTAGDFVGHTVQFLLANIIPIGIVAALIVAWSATQQRRGNQVGGSATKGLTKKQA